MSDAKVHPTAIVAPGAELGEGVEIGPFCIIDDGAKIGDGTVIEPYVRVMKDVSIGGGCHIFENTILGSTPQDHNYKGERSFVRIGDRVILRANVTIHRATGEGCETSVGDDTMIMEDCHLGHNSRVGRGVVITNKVGLSGHVDLGDWCVIGGMTGFHQFVKVGDYAMVGGMAKITNDVPPYSLVDGHPARVHGLNVVGLRRRGFTQEQRTKIKRIYRCLYSADMSAKDALTEVEARFGDDEHGRVIISFVKSLKRGLTEWGEHGMRRGASER